MNIIFILNPIIYILIFTYRIMNESDFTLRVTIIISFEREILNFRSFLSKSGIKKKSYPHNNNSSAFKRFNEF